MAGPVTNCRACGGRLAVTMADLGVQPPSNAFLASLEAAREEKRYPLRAKVCEACKLVQVDYDVAPEELFGNYVYFSSYSDGLARPREALLRDGAPAFRRSAREVWWSSSRATTAICCGTSSRWGFRCSASILPIPSRARPRASACRPWSSSSASPSAHGSPARAGGADLIVGEQRARARAAAQRFRRGDRAAAEARAAPPPSSFPIFSS